MKQWPPFTLTPTTSWHFVPVTRQHAWTPPTNATAGLFNPVLLQVGRCHSSRPSSNPSIWTLSKSLSGSHRGQKSSFVLFCLFLLLWCITLILLCNRSGFFLTCLDSFARSLPVCFFQGFKDYLNLKQHLPPICQCSQTVFNCLIVLKY